MTPDDLFQNTADAFNRCDFEEAARFFATPNTVAVGGQTIQLPDQAAFAEVLRIYRRNLDVEAFVRTEVTLTYVSAMENGKCQVFAHWTNYNDRGAEISSYDTNYIVEETADGRLQCITNEILDPVKSRLTQGMPLA